MDSKAHKFRENAKVALLDPDLQRALGKARGGFVDARTQAFSCLDRHAEIQDAAKQIKDHTLSVLDEYLVLFEKNVNKVGGKVHWARTPAEARKIVLDICDDVDARRIIKGKSMVSEEIALNYALETAGYDVVETDLGEYIIQLAGEPPSHIIAPAVHKTRQQITDLFHKHHSRLGLKERVTDIPDIVNEARLVLREAFLSADVGITGANFLVAETGSSVIVTNEGNGDLTNTLPGVHIVTTSIEKVIPTLEDLSGILRLLARNGTGQEITSYTTLSTGPRRTGDKDGPSQYHVVLLDNGRSEMLAGEFKEMLRCIRCGACLNHCPVYGAVGGHSYGWVYSGPMGAVLTPLMVGLDGTKDLPNACTLNGRCAEVCPMSIPLPDLLRKIRVRQNEERITSVRARWFMKAWGFLACKPHLYGWCLRILAWLLSWLWGKPHILRLLPFVHEWTATREFPKSQGFTFQSAYRKAPNSHE
ncbi:MAG: iron-sulfur cluster-binding protein [Rhodospirillaceae bacterium]|nr:iron-sulfur cluster-binding protein [Rhodospirillaceae bacterium]